MAFVNEFVKDEEMREFEIPGYMEYTPTVWTIDRERNVILFDYLDGNEYLPDLYEFALVIGNDIFCYRMGRYIEKNHIMWKGGFGSKISDKQYTEEADELLKEALIVYGTIGSPFDKNNDVTVEL